VSLFVDGNYRKVVLKRSLIGLGMWENLLILSVLFSLAPVSGVF